MKVSDRIAGLTGGGPDGWDIYRKSRRMIAQGVPVTELTIGEHDVRTDPSILEAMRASAAGGHTGYAALPGTDALRSAVAARIEARTGVPTSRANVVITPGGQAALFAAHVVACDPGDRALFIDPYYATYPGTIRAAGAVAAPVTAEAERDFRPDPAAIEAALPARSILINSPNNPTGVVYDRATLEGIGEVARAHDLWVISDEVYDTQIWEGSHLSPRALPGLADRTLVVGSLSKSHAMTGSRLGWLAGPEEAIAHAINLTTAHDLRRPRLHPGRGPLRSGPGRGTGSRDRGTVPAAPRLGQACPLLRRRPRRALDGQHVCHGGHKADGPLGRGFRRAPARHPCHRRHAGRKLRAGGVGTSPHCIDGGRRPSRSSANDIG